MRSFDASPLFSRSIRTPMDSALRPVSWTNSIGSDNNERVMPTPRNLAKEMLVASPWIRSFDVNMVDRYLALKKNPSGFDQYIVPQLSLQSPSMSPPRSRRRLN